MVNTFIVLEHSPYWNQIIQTSLLDLQTITDSDIFSKKQYLLNIKLKSPADINSAINKLTNNIQVAAKDSSTLIPSKNPSPNLTPDLRQLLAEKRRARSTWQWTHYLSDKTRYNMLSNKLKSLLKIHKNDSYKNYLHNSLAKIGSLWRKTKSILQLKKTIPPLCQPNNFPVVSDKEKADTLAEELSTIFIPHSISPPPLHLEMFSVTLFPITYCAIRKTYLTSWNKRYSKKKLTNRKFPGRDLITSKVTKNLLTKTIISLTRIYNATLRFSYFSTIWKSLVIVTLLKPGKPPEIPSLYRPISLLPVPGKILEKILLKRLA